MKCNVPAWWSVMAVKANVVLMEKFNAEKTGIAGSTTQKARKKEILPHRKAQIPTLLIAKKKSPPVDPAG